MLLGDKGRQTEERRQFDCHKAFHTSGSYSQAYGSKYLTATISVEWNPL